MLTQGHKPLCKYLFYLWLRDILFQYFFLHHHYVNKVLHNRSPIHIQHLYGILYKLHLQDIQFPNSKLVLMILSHEQMLQHNFLYKQVNKFHKLVLDHCALFRERRLKSNGIRVFPKIYLVQDNKHILQAIFL